MDRRGGEWHRLLRELIEDGAIVSACRHACSVDESSIFVKRPAMSRGHRPIRGSVMARNSCDADSWRTSANRASVNAAIAITTSRTAISKYFAATRFNATASSHFHVTFWAVATLYTGMVSSMAGTSAGLLEWTEQSDEDIVRQVLDGHTALFELLMRRYNERLYRAARAITRDDREAEDIIQQAYVNAFTNLRQFRGQAQFATWLTRIAINEALARVRRRGRYEPFDEDVPPVETLMPSNPAPDPEQQAFTGELRDLIEWAIDTLPDGGREVFVLRDVEGLSTAATAAALGVSEDVVKTRLSRARSALRRALIARAGAAAPDLFRFYRPRCDRVVAQVLARIAEITSPR
jgi:RNA polymerase sigma-70 factor (ECF subfamily)